MGEESGLTDPKLAAPSGGQAAPPVAAVPGVDPADVWEAAAQADAGQLTDRVEVFARIRGPRPPSARD